MQLKGKLAYSTVEFCKLGQCFIDWATPVAGEANRELTCLTLPYHSSGPIYDTSAQSTKSIGSGLFYPTPFFCLAHSLNPILRRVREGTINESDPYCILMLSNKCMIIFTRGQSFSIQCQSFKNCRRTQSCLRRHTFSNFIQ